MFFLIKVKCCCLLSQSGQSVFRWRRLRWICFANVLSTLILVPIFGIFLAYCVKQMGVVYLLFGICCSLFTLLIPIIFRKINLKYEKENWNYLSGQNQIFTQISQFAKTIKCFGLKNGIVKKWKL